MKIQINSDKTIAVDASLIRFVKGAVTRALSRFAIRLTRVEIHLSDVGHGKMGQSDKRCLIEVRPAGAGPLVVSAKAKKVSPAVGVALGKMQRSLTTFFGRMGRTLAAVPVPVSRAKKTTPAKKKKGHCEEGSGEEVKKTQPTGPKEEMDLLGSTKGLAHQIAARSSEASIIDVIREERASSTLVGFLRRNQT
jgi:Sigma 54 modulation protein / S30EA ribosomal protein